MGTKTGKLFGRKYIYRVRMLKARPFGRTVGTTFTGLHWGKRSLYIEHKRPQKALWSVNHITDIKGLEDVA